MTLHQRILDAARRTRTTLYVITAVYVGIGFFLAVPAAVSGDRLTAFLGFLIISGALAAAAVVGAVIRLTTRITAGGECFEEIRHRLERIECALEALASPGSEGVDAALVDLASFGKGDPGALVAARLDRDAFPRLVTTMEEQPPASSGMDPRLATDTGWPAPSGSTCVDPDADACEASQQEPAVRTGPGLTTKDLLREWRLGLRNADLAACRTVYSTLVGMVAPVDLAPLTAQLGRLADQTEIALREAFSACADRRDCAGMLAVGRDIVRLLHDRPVAAEFRRIEPYLVRQLKRRDGSSARTAARDEGRDAAPIDRRDDGSPAARGFNREAAAGQARPRAAAQTFRVVR
jgi:hypothetical protein